ncbi:hypothetical protein [Conexivisphaera calida]|uniref:hypothetical protein n=1 Tax=Conexivisphaera calida TaxID=1874277 RepID=UPI00157AFCB1|nr:hypothetical protein [Conexivisphaera calida]
MDEGSYVKKFDSGHGSIFISEVMEIMEEYDKLMQKVSEYYGVFADRGITVISSTSSVPPSHK